MQGARAIRVFISSTFRDMQLERDELVKRVFPQIRRMCEQRGVAWSEVDLRWGVTDEQKAEGAVLPICLAEIERTRPYFIGLLGQRYGWVPDELPPALAEELGWLTDDHGRSVTELEILHGVLNDPEATGHAFFYLRERGWVDTLDDQVRVDFVEESTDGTDRLAQLCDRIRHSGHPVRDYPDPVALGELVLRDLVALVERTYPDPTPPDPLDRANTIHASYAASRFAAFVERPALAAELDQHASGSGPPLLVTGSPGAGASALVANWAATWRSARPADAVVEHYVAAEAEAADHRPMVTRLVGELARVSGVGPPVELPDDLPALRSALRQAFASTPPRRVVLVVDGVDDLADVDGAPDLRWLPSELPDTVRIVVTASGPRPRATFEHRRWAIQEVPLLDAPERREVAARFLAGFSKTLDRTHLDTLAAAPNTGNARFLRIVVDELRQHGDHFTLGEVIARLCAAATVDDLYEMVLARYEQDFERDRPGLVRDAMTALWAARRGLAESELLDVLGEGSPLPQAVWSPLHLAAEQGLVSRSGLLGLADDDLRTAVEDRYLTTTAAKSDAHHRLAGYFAAQPVGPRVVDELGWQLADAGELERLATTLADPAFTELAYVRAAADLRRLWARAESAGHPMTAAYAPIVDHPSAFDGEPGDGGQLVWGVARLLTDAGHPTEALRLNRHLVERARLAPAGRHEAPGGDAYLRSALVNLGAALWLQGALDEADPPLAEALERCRSVGDRAMLAAALGNLGLVRRDRGNLDQAEQLFVEEADVCRALDDHFGLQASLGNRAQLLRQLGRYDDALALLTEQEQLCRDLSDEAGVVRAQAGQATVLADRGDNAAAADLITRQVDRCREEGDTRGLAEALLNLSVAQGQLGLAPESAASSIECEAIVRRLADPGLLARVLVVRSTAVSATGNWVEVERLAREAELTARGAGQAAQVALALGLVGTARREQGDLRGCRDAHAAELVVASQTGDPHAIAIAHTNLGNLAIAEQRLDDALVEYDQAEPTFRELDVPSSLLPLLANRAQLFHATDRFAEALADYAGAATAASRLGNQSAAKQWGEAGIKLAYQVGDVTSAETLWSVLADTARATTDEPLLQRALGERALLLINRAQPHGVAGDASNVDQELLAVAWSLLLEQDAVCRRIGDSVGLAACVGNRAIVLRYRGDLEGSLHCLDEQLDVAQRSSNAQAVLFATANRGEVLGLLGRTDEALDALGTAKSAAAQYQLGPMVQQLDAMIAALQARN